MAQLVLSMSGVVLGGVVESWVRISLEAKYFTASIGSVDSLYPSVYIYIYRSLFVLRGYALLLVSSTTETNF